jgi:large subunit ribosomal protein L24
MAARIKKGDSVMVLAGKDKGKTGQVLTVLNQESRIVVQGVNMVRRHTRPSAQTTGGIIQKEASLHVSNVAHVDPKTNEATRVGFRVLEDGRKVRYAKRSGEVIDS